MNKASQYKHYIRVIEVRIESLTKAIDNLPDSNLNSRRREERKALRWALRVIRSNPVMAQDTIKDSESGDG